MSVGLEAPVVILIRNGGQLGHAISLGVSRATTKLVMFSTDDGGIMEKAASEEKVKKVDSVQDQRSIYDHIKIPEESDQARWSLVGSALHSLHTSLPGHMQTILKNFLENQTRYAVGSWMMLNRFIHVMFSGYFWCRTLRGNHLIPCRS